MAAYWTSEYKCPIFRRNTYFQQIAEGRHLLPPSEKERREIHEIQHKKIPGTYDRAETDTREHLQKHRTGRDLFSGL